MDYIDPILFRTDFTDDDKWESICNTIRDYGDKYGLPTCLEFRNDPTLNGLTKENVEKHLSERYLHDFHFYFIADKQTMDHPDNPILCVSIPDEIDPEEKSFRVIPWEINNVEGNLRISNMDFEDYVFHLDSDNIFRRF